LITNTGKNILAKYLIGQTQSYASYLAVGVGQRPLAVGQSFPSFATKEQLEFEVLRTPITSRGFVYDENGNPNVVFIAELPSEQRYSITEIGIYPGRSNPAAGALDSRMVYSFGESENWEYHTESATLRVEKIVSPLNLDQPSGQIAVEDVVFRTNSNNTIFSAPIRVNLFERPRFLDTTMMLRGDLSFLTPNTNTGSLEVNPLAPSYAGSHIHFNGVSLDFDSNSTEDELRLAFSVLSKEDVQAEDVQSVRLLVEFVNADVPQPTNFAKFEVVLNESDSEVNFLNNRYFVVKKKFSELARSSNFTWGGINSVRVYATVLEIGSSLPSENFYISLDGLRFENTTIKSPLYGLTGYSVIKTLDGRPIIKESNASTSIEFRFGLGVE
jgi:hypothetical protein